MQLHQLKKVLFIFILVLLFGGGLILTFLSYSESPLLIESSESKTSKGNSVFNQIQWIKTTQKDIWMMNQSFDGIHGKNWERLAIVVDKKKRPLTARFYQIKAGELKWSENLIDERVPYRVSCYTCHANGPRAIRPVPESKKANLGFFEKAKLLLWNTRIKSYGRIHYDPTHDQEDLSLNPPFRDRSFKANDPLPVKTCLQCHQEDGLIARGALTRQHSDTIKYLVENKQMPPLGFSLTEAEKNQLVDYLKGF